MWDEGRPLDADELGRLERAEREIEARTGGPRDGLRTTVELPERLSSASARELERRLAARGWREAHYHGDSREAAVRELVDLLLGLDRPEPRVELSA